MLDERLYYERRYAVVLTLSAAVLAKLGAGSRAREQGGAGGSLEPPGRLIPTHLVHAAYMEEPIWRSPGSGAKFHCVRPRYYDCISTYSIENLIFIEIASAR